MLIKSRALAFLIILLAGLAAWPAAADSPPVPPNTTGPIFTDTAVPVPKGQFTLQPFLSVSFVGGNFTNRWRRESARGDLVSLEMPVKLTYGLARNLETSLQVPFIQNWAGHLDDPGPRGNRTAQFGGLGDLQLTFKYQLLEETPRRPTVSAVFSVGFPTGHRFRLNPGKLGTDVLGAGAYAFTPGLNLSKWLGPVCLYTTAWYSLATTAPPPAVRRLSGPLLVPAHGRDLLSWNLAGEWVLSKRWVALLEFYSSYEMGPIFGRSREPTSLLMGLLPGVEFIFSPRLAFALGVALDLAGKNSPHAYTPIFTLLLNF